MSYLNHSSNLYVVCETKEGDKPVFIVCILCIGPSTLAAFPQLRMVSQHHSQSYCRNIVGDQMPPSGHVRQNSSQMLNTE